MNSEAPDQQVCLNCGAHVSGDFCSQCGQASGDRLVPVSDWFKEFFESFLSLDSKLLRTLTKVLLQPGEATIDFGRGKRVQYVSPAKIYIIVSAISIAAMTIQGAFSGDALSMGVNLDREMQKKMQFLFPIVNLLSPFLTAGILALVQHRFYFQLHLAFSLHIWTFFVAVATPMIFIPPTSVWAIISFLALTLIVTGYLLIAHTRVYAMSIAQRLFSCCILVMSIPFASLLFSASLVILVRVLP